MTTTDPADERRRAEHVIAAQLSRSWADRQESLRRAHSIVTALDGAGYTVAPKVGALFPHKGMTPEQVAQWRERWNAAVRAPQAATEPATAPRGPGAAQDATDGSAAESEPRPNVEGIARCLSAGDVEINHGDYPAWDDLRDGGRDQYRQLARYLLARYDITPRTARGDS